ncbi:DOMON domain-containing protein FRRS1L-like [Acanthaster planci]|uniref:DOMON domain-containing protein FRRS1L-like n=1 Tax=Acanthaster planci TaxID=133434 RepID=A0A8B7Z2R9_ACAPL|nr:DOMON domain-containing protein FRRS1L-like [Acanthaster planci]
MNARDLRDMMSVPRIVTFLLLLILPGSPSRPAFIAAHSSSVCTQGTACWRRPRDCAGTACDYAAEWSVDRGTGEITLAFLGRSNGWVAVGFSGDQAMAGDDVLMCIADLGANSTGARFEHRYNYGYSNLPAELEGITVNSASFTDGILQCSVTREVTVFNSSHMTFDLSFDWFMLFAQGPITSSGQPVRHSKNPSITDRKVTLSSLDEIFVLGESRSQSHGQDESGVSDEKREGGSNGGHQHTVHFAMALFVGLSISLIFWFRN